MEFWYNQLLVLNRLHYKTINYCEMVGISRPDSLVGEGVKEYCMNPTLHSYPQACEGYLCGRASNIFSEYRVNFNLYIQANITNVCLWLIDSSYTQYMYTSCVECIVKGDVSVRTMIPGYNINSSPSLCGNSLYVHIHNIIMLNCMYSVDMVVHPL